MAEQARLQVGIVGYGFVGQKHAAILQGHPGFACTGVVDPTPAARAAATREGLTTYPTLEALLAAQPATECVAICTPNGTHTDLALEVLRADRHVIIEKPMGLRATACQAVNTLAEERLRHVFVVMQNRYTPVARWLHDVVQSGQLGRLLFVEVNCFWNRDHRYYLPGSWRGTPDQDGGVLYTQFSHFIDLLLWLFGQVHVKAATMAKLRNTPSTSLADTGFLQLDLPETDAMGTFNFSTGVWDRNLESSLTILGENGSVKVGGQYMNHLEACHIDGVAAPSLPETAPPNRYGPYEGSAANHHYVYENVLDVLRRGGRPSTTGAEGQAVVAFIEAAYRLAN